ncbi:N66 matrix protein-like [Dreissena polymorpha]|nr:N66 matrix protein-like [Dreissena polymorpha]
MNIQNGQWLSSGQNGFNSQWPVNGQNGQFSPNGLNGQLSVNGQNGHFSPNGLSGQLSVNGQTGQLMDQSHVLPNSWAINGQQSNTFSTTDTFGSGMPSVNSDPWGMYKQLAMDSSLGTQSASRNQGALNQQTGFDNGFLAGSGQTGWTPIDGFRNENQNFNNGFTSPNAGSATNFGVNLPPRTG